MESAQGIESVDELVRLRSLYTFLTSTTDLFVLEKYRENGKEVPLILAGYQEVAEWGLKRLNKLIKDIEAYIGVKKGLEIEMMGIGEPGERGEIEPGIFKRLHEFIDETEAAIKEKRKAEIGGEETDSGSED